MSMEEYEIECLRKEAEMEDEESRKESQVANEHWIDAMDEALKRVRRMWKNMEKSYEEWNNKPFDNTSVRCACGILRGIRDSAATLLPKDHEKYMDQQGDQPNKKG